MNRANVVAVVGEALRASLAAALQAVDHSAGTARPDVHLKLLRVAASPVPRGRRPAPDEPPGEPPLALELEYLAWIDGAETDVEERLIGAVLAWLHTTPLHKVAARGEVAGSAVTWQVQLTPVSLERGELLRLWSLPEFSGRALLAFEARVLAGSG